MYYNHTPTIKEIVDTSAERFGDRSFIKYIENDNIIEKSYNDVKHDSYAICRMLRNFSKEKIHIAVIGKTGYEYLMFMTGALMSGNVVVPLNTDMSVPESISILNNADIEMLIYDEHFSDKVSDVVAGVPSIKRTINLNEQNLLKNITDEYSASSKYANLSDYEFDSKECSLIMYTSGTTGTKKGVMLSTYALVKNVMYTDYCQMLNEGEVSLTFLPMYHLFCFSGDYVRNLMDGVTLCISKNIRTFQNDLKVFEPSVMRIVPMMAQSLLKRVKNIMHRNPDISQNLAAQQVFGKNLKWLISGAAYLPYEYIEEYEKLGIFLRQGYGMTEAGCRISVPVEQALPDSVGKVIDICDVRVKNKEIQVKTPSVMLGYYKMPKETAKMFTDDGWLRTGDIGSVTEDGQLFITGRLKNLIILSSGENVSPEAIEKKFNGYPIVSEVMVYAKNDGIVAEIYPDHHYCSVNGIDNPQEEITEKIRQMNATAKPSHVISEIIIRTEPFEKTGSGKIKRKGIN